MVRKRERGSSALVHVLFQVMARAQRFPVHRTNNENYYGKMEQRGFKISSARKSVDASRNAARKRQLVPNLSTVIME